jgi:hypothetical protein
MADEPTEKSGLEVPPKDAEYPDTLFITREWSDDPDNRRRYYMTSDESVNEVVPNDLIGNPVYVATYELVKVERVVRTIVLISTTVHRA